MTISSTLNRVNCPGNGSATVFSFSPVVIQNPAQLAVTMVDNLGNQTLLSLGTANSQYSVNVTSYPGVGSITYPATGSVGGTTLPAGWSLTIDRIVPLLQGTSLGNNAAYFSAVIESTFDYLTMIAQQLQEQLSRALLAAVTDPDIPMTLPTVTQRKNNMLGFDSNGNPIAAQPSSALVSTPMQPIVNASSIVLAVSLLGLRIPLTGNTNFFVDNVNGTDSVTHGLASGTSAWRTINYALATVAALYDGRGFTGTVSVAGTGGQTYAEQVQVVTPFFGFSQMTMSCNATLKSVLIQSAAPMAVKNGVELYITGGFWFSCTAANGSAAFTSSFGGQAYLSGVTTDASLGIGFYATRGGYIEFLTDCHFLGGLTWFNLMQCSHQGNIRHSNGAILQMDGATACSDAFLYTDYGDITITASANFNTNSHAMSGQRFRAAENGIIQWVDGSNGTETSIPGSSPGVCISGGKYVYGNGFLSDIVSGTTTYDMTQANGTTVDFQIGFVPAEIEFLCSVNGGAAGMMASVGFCTMGYGSGGQIYQTTGQYVVAGGVNGAQPTANNCIYYFTSGSAFIAASVTAIDANGNGITLTFAKGGAPTGTLTIMYKARKGL